MKRAIVCYNCGKLKKESETYQVKIKDFAICKTQEMNGNFVENKVKICRQCAKSAGYKVKAKKKTPSSPSKTGAKVSLSNG